VTDTELDRVGHLPIPLSDLARQHAVVAAEIADGWARTVAAGAFVGGDEVDALEGELAAALGVRSCVTVASGTDALELLLRATNVPRGAEVVLPTNTFVGAAEAVLRAGCRVRLVDCEPLTHLMDLQQVADALDDSKVGAVLAVHLYGQAVPVERLTALHRRGPIVLIEDAGQADGARRRGRAVGTLGLAAATSFYPGKNLGAYGDGGAILTDHEGIADTVRLLRNHGSVAPGAHEIVGCNSRLDSVQAVVLRAKLRWLEQWNFERREAAHRYDVLLADLPAVQRPATLAGNDHVWHLYVVEVPERDRVLARMRDAGVLAAVHYPVPIHLQRAFRWLGKRAGSFPVAEAAAKRVISLPIFPGISPAEQERVVSVLAEAMNPA
jgi:dTDP-4-amino-4,6-dideoxygalactose transaminase